MPSLLDTHGPKAAETASLWWLMFWISAAVFVLVVALLALAVLRQIRPRATDERGLVHLGRLDGLTANSLVIGIGLLLPAAVMVLLLVVDLHALSVLASPVTPARLTVQIKGHQFWWEVRYAEAQVTTANEIHVPVGEPVLVKLRSADVIHSLWVPQLHGKRDLIPGHDSSFWIEADRAGTFGGQCAEFCGYQHAQMRLLVVAESRGAFDGWLAQQRQPAAEPADDRARRGREVFLSGPCVLCHTITGTPAAARVGPDLTHLAGRTTIAAGILPNTPGHLAGWILDPQRIKPGVHMPSMALEAADLQALLAYLGTLR
jgi:cytochrome c oxidase subunit 2